MSSISGQIRAWDINVAVPLAADMKNKFFWHVPNNNYDYTLLYGCLTCEKEFELKAKSVADNLEILFENVLDYTDFYTIQVQQTFPTTGA